MDRYEEFFMSAREKITLADHMATMTFPMVQEPKVLFVSLENTFLAMEYTIEGILAYERKYKRIPPFSDSFEGRLQALKAVEKKYRIDKKIIGALRGMRETITKHKESPLEFSRDGKFVICTANYKMKILTFDELKGYLTLAKQFVHETSAMIV